MIVWVDVILAAVLLEALILACWLRARRRPYLPLLMNLAAGACLLLAVRSALAGTHWLLLLALTGALAAHLADLRYRI